MKLVCALITSAAALQLVHSVWAGGAQLLSYITPSYFDFGQSSYRITASETNFVITIFRTGEFRESAAVDFATRDGTAVAGRNYSSVSRRLFFSLGAGFITVSVPIHSGAPANGDSVFYLDLKNPSPGSVVVSGSATITLVMPARNPAASVRLDIRPTTNQTVVITWPSNSGDLVLEKCASPAGTNWAPVSATPSNSGGVLSLTDNLARGTCFYRLRKP